VRASNIIRSAVFAKSSAIPAVPYRVPAWDASWMQGERRPASSPQPSQRALRQDGLGDRADSGLAEPSGFG
jgi:hypothetical protein